MSVSIPILEEVLGKSSAEIRAIFESWGFQIQGWEKLRTDNLEIALMLN